MSRIGLSSGNRKQEFDADGHRFLHLTGPTAIARQRAWILATDNLGAHTVNLPEFPVSGDTVSVLSGENESVELLATGDYLVGGLSVYVVSRGPRFASFLYVEAVTDWLILQDIPHII